MNFKLHSSCHLQVPLGDTRWFYPKKEPLPDIPAAAAWGCLGPWVFAMLKPPDGKIPRFHASSRQAPRFRCRNRCQLDPNILMRLAHCSLVIFVSPFLRPNGQVCYLCTKHKIKQKLKDASFLVGHSWISVVLGGLFSSIWLSSGPKLFQAVSVAQPPYNKRKGGLVISKYSRTWTVGLLLDRKAPFNINTPLPSGATDSNSKFPTSQKFHT